MCLHGMHDCAEIEIERIELREIEHYLNLILQRTWHYWYSYSYCRGRVASGIVNRDVASSVSAAQVYSYGTIVTLSKSETYKETIP